MPTEIVSATLEPPSVYGKLPARGDFVTRGFGRPVIDAWDAWLQPAILASRDALAERWLDIYLTSPIWRFALGAGNCGPNTLVGVLLPSVDKVGRCFPLMLGRELAPGIELTALIARASSWYRTVEELGLAALAPEFQLEAFEEPVALEVDATISALEATEPLAAPGLYIPLSGDSRSVALRHAHQPLAQGRTLWWTSGSERVAPCLLICPGMPSPLSFASLLDGDWTRGGWLGLVEAIPEPEEAAPPIEIASAAADADDLVAQRVEEGGESSGSDSAGDAG